MSQDHSISKRARRAARAQRTNKPVLVTNANSDSGNSEEEYGGIGTATQTIDEVPALVVPTPEPIEQPARRLPRFFSSVRKSEEDTAQKEAKEAEVVQARLARATRSKASAEVTPAKATPVEGKKATATTPAKAAPAKPQGIFKTRYIIGMGLYLLAADFLGLYEQKLLAYLGLEKELTRLNLFGAPLHVTTSTIAFLASLIIILVLLARFDLIPRSLGGQRSRTTARQSQTRNTTIQGERVSQPTIRQGVQGADDSLYKQYRSNQRKKK
jgi:hypothetical protein